MPSLGADMDSGTVAEWRVAPGDLVHRGDIVAVVSTSKADIDVEVFETGIVQELLVPEGTEVAVGTALARIGPEVAPSVEPPSHLGPDQIRPTSDAPLDQRPAAPERRSDGTAQHPLVRSPLVRHLAEARHLDLDSVVGTGPGGVVTRRDVESATPPRQRVRSSPYARALAAARRIDLTSVLGSGPGGAVVARDIELRRPVAAAPAGDRPERRHDARRAVGEAMARSKRDVPHYYLSTTIDLHATMSWAAEINATREVAERLVPAAVLLRAVAVAAASNALVNGHWVDDGFRPADHVALGVAVSRRGGGLVAPVIDRADQLGTDELMARLRRLVAHVRRGSLTSSEVADATITVTNLGERGAEAVHGVITPPQVALVGFGRIVERPWAVDGMLTVRPVVTATLAADHRVSDGLDGSRFLQDVDRLLQEPSNLAQVDPTATGGRDG